MAERIRPTAVITSHTSADYDALAAMVAASKLYPDAALIAPPTLERQGPQLYTDSIVHYYNLRQPETCDFSGVTLLVVVDAYQKSRLSHVQAVFDNPGLEIHLYDHHTQSTGDLPAHYSVVKPWGSTSTILTHIIKEKGIPLNPDEATLLGLGIYEDTGSFTFTSTTEHDFTAAAFLSGLGMSLTTISELISTDLTREQVHMLDTLLRNAVTHSIQGISITITDIVLDKFMGDFASLVHRLADMENIKILFALAAMGDRVHMIARSKSQHEVDVGHICSSFGGGGHSFAASASIKGIPLAQVRSELLAFLIAIITPQMAVGRHMTHPAITADDTMTIAQAETLMNRFGLKAIPVLPTETGGEIGLLEHQTASKAAAHNLGHLPVTEYMRRDISTLEEDAALSQAVEIMIGHHQRLIPVMRGKLLQGVLTRTDIIRLAVGDNLHLPESMRLSLEHQESNIASLVQERLPEEHVRILKTAGRLGDELHMDVFAVGGFVRDLLLKQPNLDTDLSVEGDGIAFAERLADLLGGTVRPHQKFKTAIVFYKDSKGMDQHLDVATARREYYEQPAALPRVEVSSIRMDLYRRDFTINALAIQINSKRFGTLIDPFGGQRDIKERTINVLHSLSFVEDPTRILRAVRFERRFQFRIGAQTEWLLKNAMSLDMLGKLSGSRLFNELKHVFDEKDVPSCIRRMESWNLLRVIHPLLKLSPAKDILIASIDEILTWYRLLYKNPLPRNWVLYLLGLCSNSKYVDASSLLTSLGLIQRMKTDFLTLRENTRKAGGQLQSLCKQENISMGKLYEILQPLEIEGHLYLMAKYGHEHDIGKHVSLYLTHLKDVTADITGADLISMGERPGPLFRETFHHVLTAKLDGIAPGREEQLALAAEFLAARHKNSE